MKKVPPRVPPVDRRTARKTATHLAQGWTRHEPPRSTEVNQ